MIWHSGRLRLCSFQWKNTEHNHGKCGARSGACMKVRWSYLFYHLMSEATLMTWVFWKMGPHILEWRFRMELPPIGGWITHVQSHLNESCSYLWLQITSWSRYNPIIIPSQSFSHSIPCYIFLDRYVDIFWNHLPACFFAITILKEDHLGSHPKGFLFRNDQETVYHVWNIHYTMSLLDIHHMPSCEKSPIEHGTQKSYL